MANVTDDRTEEATAATASPVAHAGSLRRAFFGASWSLVGTAIARLAALVAVLIAARHLGSQKYGEYALAQATLATVAIGSMGLSLAATKLIADDLAVDRSAAGRHLAVIFGFGGAVAAVIAMTMLGSAPFVAGTIIGRPELTGVLRAGALLLVASPFVESIAGALTGAHRFGTVSRLNALRGAFDAAGIVGGAMAGGPAGALVGYGLAEVATAAVGALMLKGVLRREGIVLRFDDRMASLREVARFSLPALSGSVLLQLALWVSQLVLARHDNGVELVGYFSLANKWYLAALFIPTAAGTVLLPTLGSLHAAESDADFARVLRVFVLVNLAITVPAALLLAVLASRVVGVQGGDFGAATNTLRLLALAVVPTALNTVLSQAAIAKGRVRIWLVSDAVLAIVLLSTSLVLVPRHGAEGLAVAYGIAYTATCLAIVPAFLKRRPLRTWRLEAEGAKGDGSMAPALVGFYAFVAVALAAAVTGRDVLHRWPALCVGPAAFVVVQAIVPRMRPRRDPLLGPFNFAWALFGLKLVGQPLILAWFGASKGSLVQLPSDRAMNKTMFVIVLGWVASALAAAVLTSPSADKAVRPSHRRSYRVPNIVAIGFVLVGLVGVWLRFRTPGQFLSYFSFNGGAGQPDAPLVGTLSRPFGAYGFLMLMWRDWGNPRSVTRSIRMVAFALGAFVCVSSYDYNRAAFLVPIVATIATYSRFVKPLRFRTIATGTVALLVLVYAFGNVRRIEIGTAGGKFSKEDALLTGAPPSLTENLEVYGQAPQFSAVVIEHVDGGGALRYGRSMLGSALSPVPLLGKPFRAQSSTVEYNALVYQRSGLVDQVVPFEAELYWNFGAAGVAGGYLALGAIIAFLERRLRRASTVIDGFVVIYASIWSSFLIVGQILSVAQVAVYFGGPVFVLGFVRFYVAQRTRSRDLVPYTALVSPAAAIPQPQAVTL